MIRFASFDIGKKNFSFCIEEFNKEHLLSITNIPFLKRYEKNGTCTKEFQSILDKVFKNGKIVLYKNVDLTEDCNPDVKLDPQTFHNMNYVLDSYSHEFDKCSAIIIEEQMGFGKTVNLMAVKLAQHCYSYFTFKYGKYKEIIEFPATNKTQILGAEKIPSSRVCKNGTVRYKAMDKPARKKWAVKKAKEIFIFRKDEFLKEIEKAKKKDDLADCFLQLQACKYLVFVERELKGSKTNSVKEKKKKVGKKK